MKKKIFCLKFEIFYESHPPTRHIKYKRIDFKVCYFASKLNQTSRSSVLENVPNWLKEAYLQ